MCVSVGMGVCANVQTLCLQERALWQEQVSVIGSIRMGVYVRAYDTYVVCMHVVVCTQAKYE
jgi:hypothetical protein